MSALPDGWRAPVMPTSAGAPGVTAVDLARTPAWRVIPSISRRWLGDQGDDAAGLAGAGGTAAAVQVVLVVGGRVDVDDEVEVVDVDAAGRDVGGHQHGDRAVLELGQVRVRCGCDLPPCSARGRTPLVSRCLVSRSTACLVSRNMITRPSRAAISRVASCLSARVDVQHVVLHRGDRARRRVDRVGDRVVQVARGPAGRRCGRGWRRTASAGPRGRWSSRAVTWGMKPMSAIWSASSRTVMATWSSRQSPRSMRSLSRPGSRRRPRRRRAAARLPADRHAADDRGQRTPTARAYGVSASVTCWASSRVGTRTRASGRLGAARRGAGQQRPGRRRGSCPSRCGRGPGRHGRRGSSAAWRPGSGTGR